MTAALTQLSGSLSRRWGQFLSVSAIVFAVPLFAVVGLSLPLPVIVEGLTAATTAGNTAAARSAGPGARTDPGRPARSRSRSTREPAYDDHTATDNDGRRRQRQWQRRQQSERGRRKSECGRGERRRQRR